jgi:bis(5'-nucleosyl)-tetraphosphatase (symmetrical)
MTMARTIIVGDVHGCLSELKALVAKLQLNSEDRLIACGDLVDRGPDSAGVVRYLMAIGAESVMGNHDSKLVRYAAHEHKAKLNPQYRNPMQYSAEREDITSNLGEEELAWLAKLPSFIRLRDLNKIVVHAGVLDNDNVETQTREVLTMVRYVSKTPPGKMLSLVMPGYKAPENSTYWTGMYKGTTDIVFGHNVADLHRPVAIRCPGGAMAYGIDTGVCFGGKLTAMVIDNFSNEHHYVQVAAEKTYASFEVVRPTF